MGEMEWGAWNGGMESGNRTWSGMKVIPGHIAILCYN